MDIIYVSKLCSPRVFQRLYETASVKPAQQAQKYNRLMAEGLAGNPGVRVLALGATPVSRGITRQYLFRSKKEVCGSLTYQTVPVVNFPLLTQAMLFLGTLWRVLRTAKREDSAVVCDALNISMSAAALLAAWLKGVRTVGIVTDVPGYYASPTNRLVESLGLFIMHGFSSYVFLTHQMNDVVNKKKRPYVVIEGQVDINAANAENRLEDKLDGKVCVYTGSLAKEYGIQMLVQAFMLAAVPESVLLIYGAGDYEKELREVCASRDDIRFGGTLPNEEIVALQRRATLLVNPRPTQQEFTKYSFPSKNMEYIASGTPLLTTRLPGMPDEYLPYVYLFDSETKADYANVLRATLSLPAEELHQKGLRTREFAIREKNNVAQAGKLLRLIWGEKYI